MVHDPVRQYSRTGTVNKIPCVQEIFLRPFFLDSCTIIERYSINKKQRKTAYE